MKCPKCGFVSYPGLPQCKKCGHRFHPATRKETSSSILSLFSGTPVPAASAAEAAAPVSTPESSATPSPSGSPPAEPAASAPKVVPAPELTRPWREELTERVENFRRRRARLRQGEDLNLDFNFPPAAGAETESAANVPDTGMAFDAEEIHLTAGEPDLDVSLETPSAREADMPVLDALPLERPRTESDVSAEFEAATLDQAEPTPAEIVLEPLPPALGRALSPPPELSLPPAPLGRRFIAGLADTLVLVAAAGLFGLVFWRAGGRLSLRPINLLILSFIALFFTLVYFGLFTALTGSTPGLLWMGIEVRNLEGDPPSPGQAAWRAFGYLVSMAGLMLGFIWALVDSDGLTWHDRISGTFLTVVPKDRRQGF